MIGRRRPHRPGRGGKGSACERPGPARRPAGWIRDLAAFLIPDGCLVCGTWIPRPHDGRLTYAACRSRLPAAPWPRCSRCHHPLATGREPGPSCRECDPWPAAVTRARWAWMMEPPADALVHGLKYEGWAGLAREMGEAMVRALGRGGDPPWALVTPVPTTGARERARGYNQARLLAGVVARRLGLPLVRTLVRVRGGPTQVALPPSQRRANVKGAFQAVRPARTRLAGAHVVLVDDVLTTGATAAQAATVLDRAGAAEVTVLTFARALPSRRVTTP